INWRVRLGVTLVQRGTRIGAEAFAELQRLLQPVSELYLVEDDETFDGLGTLTSCAGGILAEIARLLCLGFDITAPHEQRLCWQSLSGALRYLLASGKSPEAIIREVANPGGLTEVGVGVLAEELPVSFGEAARRMGERLRLRQAEVARMGDMMGTRGEPTSE